MAKIINNREIVTGEVRLSYAHLFTPVARPNALPGEAPRYSVCLLIDKADTATVKAITDAIEAAIVAGIPTRFNGKRPKNLRTPLRDGDEERDLDKNPEYAGHYFINCNSTRQPGLIDTNRQQIIDPNTIYSGCYAKAHIQFYAYSASGNVGVACSIVNVLKTRDGESFGGTALSAADAFADEFDDDLI